MSSYSTALDLELYHLYANRIDQILLAANVGLWDWNMINNTVQFDRVWASLIGYDISEVQFELSFWEERVHPEDLDRCYKDIKKHLDGKMDFYENIHRMKHKNGEWVYILDRGKVTEWENGKPVRFMGTHVDITELMKSKLKVDNLINDSINSAKSQSAFLANITHEIRSPLNAIMGFAKLVLDEIEDEDHRENLHFIHQSASKILAMTNDILDFSKIEAGKFEIHNTACNLNEIIDSVLKTFLVTASDKGINLTAFVESDVPASLFADPLRLNQILTNLVGNALKFTEEGGWVCLTATVKQQADDGVILLLSIVDTGIGIAAEHQEKIFLDYSQADSSISHQYGGTGLGLAISSNLIELMGGNIWLVSEPGIGSAFYFTIKAGVGDTVASTPHIKNESRDQADLDILHGKNMLLVEDDEINLMLARSILETAGINVKTASNGREALEILSSEKFDCVLMDCHMPIMSGCDATHQLRQLKSFDDLLIIAMTANEQSTFADESVSSLFNDFITKPYDPEKMLSSIAFWVQKRFG